MFWHTTKIKALWEEEGWYERCLLPMGNELAGFVDASSGRYFLYILYPKLLKNNWTRHHSSHPQPWQSIADLLCCSGLVQSGCTASLSLFWECERIFMYYRRLTIKISLSAPLSVGRMTASLLPPVMWGARTGGTALTAADQLVTCERRRLRNIWE